ncbi:GNAT family N-acetyltransferase [Streptomyces sp. NPDC047028]|uniref:GNAT family N-acetyltransferase n=1 Tax=Streptomyces sp. NPDC047028 TaxID=3155793 RepID=UPI00340C16FC
MSAHIRVFPGEDLSPHSAALHSVYSMPSAPHPGTRTQGKATACLGRLEEDVKRPGFTAAVALEGPDVVGFTTAWTTMAPFPTDRCYPQATVGLGPQRTAEWLCGAGEIDELAVRPAVQGTGLAAELLEAVTADAPEGRSWLLTSVRASRAMAFYRRQGWTQATHPAPEGEGVAVFLGPRHPAGVLAAPPL